MSSYDNVLRRSVCFLTGFALIFFFFSSLLAYDSPDFDREVFDVDALLLEGDARESLVEALASIASNFPDSTQVDSDLKEKCLAIALRISPLHYNSRKAHEALLKGQVPPATSFFDSLSAASEAIWGVAERLSTNDSEPEARKLAPYLMEIALLIHPEPPRERINKFALATERELLPWGEMVRLQPAENPSSRVVSRFFDKIEERELEKAETKMAAPAKPETPENLPQNLPESSSGAEIKIAEVSLPFVSSLIVRNTPVAGGLATLVIRDPSAIEDDLFAKVKAEDDPTWAEQLQMVGDFTGIPPAGLRTIALTVREGYPDFPLRKVAEIGFKTEEELSTPRALAQADVTLAGTIMLYSAFSGDPIDQNFVFAGSLGDTAATRESPISMEGELSAVIASAALLEKPYLVLPASSYEGLLAGVKESGNLESLFSPQLLGVENLEGALQFAMQDNGVDFAAAVDTFLEIEEVASKMSLVDLARNSKVQERLEKILEQFPNHLSAKVMLAFGRDEP